MLRKSPSNREISFDRKCVPGHDVFGSKGFTEQLSRVKRSGPGTMIRRPIAKSNRSRGAKRNRARYSGESFRQLAELNAAICRGLKHPRGEWRFSSRWKRWKEVGQRVYCFDPARSGANRIERGSERTERARENFGGHRRMWPGAATSFRQSGNR